VYATITHLCSACFALLCYDSAWLSPRVLLFTYDQINPSLSKSKLCSVLAECSDVGEEGLRETKNSTFGLAIEDRGRQYQLRRTKDVRPGPVWMESMKMETCHMAEHYREREF